MRKRNYRVTLYLDHDEMEMLRRKSRASGLDHNKFIRTLLSGFEPRQAPDERFWKAMEFIREFAEKIDEIAMKADSAVDMAAIMLESKKWRLFQNAIEKELLRPKGCDGSGSN